MKSWQEVFRRGLAPLLSDAELGALRDGLEKDDKRLLHGATCDPPLVGCVLDWPCDGACLIGYGPWVGGGAASVGEVNARFGELCGAIDARLGAIGACGAIVNFWDGEDEPDLAKVRREVLSEVRLALSSRAVQEAAPCRG